MEFIIPSILTSAPGPLELKQPQNMTGPPLYFTVGMTCFFLYAFLFLPQTCRCYSWQKCSILVSSEQSTLFQSECKWRLANSKRFFSVSCGQKRLSSGNPSNEAVVMEVASDGAFWNLVTPRRHQSILYLSGTRWAQVQLSLSSICNVVEERMHYPHPCFLKFY